MRRGRGWAFFRGLKPFCFGSYAGAEAQAREEGKTENHDPPSKTRVSHWDGAQPLWACWYPDGKHTLLNAIQSSERGYFLTDADGTAPKSVTTDFVSLRSGVTPDRHTLLVRRNGARGIRPDVADDFKVAPTVASGDIPIAWTTDAKHVFVQDHGSCIAATLEVAGADARAGCFSLRV